MNEEKEVCTFNGMISSHIKKKYCPYGNMDETWGHYYKWNNLVPDRKTVYDFIDMGYLK